jgi:AcrR family transcriptional regulator
MRTQIAPERKNEVSEQIVDAAERLLKTYGYQKMTMTDLAAEAGIGVGTTYLHFASKTEVIVAVAERFHSSTFNHLQEAAELPIPSADKIRLLLWIRIRDKYDRCRGILSNVSWSQFHRHGNEFVADLKSADPDRMDRWRKRELDILAAALAAGIQTGQFWNVEPHDAALTLLTATRGFMPDVLQQDDFAHPDAFKERVQSVLSMLVNGLVVDRQLTKVNEICENLRNL